MSLLLDASFICLGSILGLAGYAMIKLANKQWQEEGMVSSAKSVSDSEHHSESGSEHHSENDDKDTRSVSTVEIVDAEPNPPPNRLSGMDALAALISDPETDHLLDRVTDFSVHAENLLRERHKDNPIVTDFLQQAFKQINDILEDLDHEKIE